MTEKEDIIELPLFDLVNCISDAADLVNSRIILHHKRVAYIAHAVAKEMGMSSDQVTTTLLSGLLHDVGALACSELDKNKLLNFDVDNPHDHALIGYLMLLKFKQFKEIAETVRCHHVPWQLGEGRWFLGKEVPLISHVIHLADRIDIITRRDHNILAQVSAINAVVAGHNRSLFHPDAVHAFNNLSAKESFWLDLSSPSIKEILANIQEYPVVKTDSTGLLEFAHLISHINDFRSSFTVTHSSGVAVCAATLGELLEMSEKQINQLGIAGYLHDLGKLAVPREILDKASSLTDKEYDIIKKHAYFTKRILDNVQTLSDISFWASSHHEHLDGTGYPFHLRGENLDQGSRIIAISDIFTALLEDRPYRRGMQKKEVITILQQGVKEQVCDALIVEVLIENFDLIDTKRRQAQEKEEIAYQQFWSSVTKMLERIILEKSA